MSVKKQLEEMLISHAKEIDALRAENAALREALREARKGWDVGIMMARYDSPLCEDRINREWLETYFQLGVIALYLGLCCDQRGPVKWGEL